jgi:hypothetical protein
MGLKKGMGILLGLIGFCMIFYSLAQGAITGNVIGTDGISKTSGILGLLFMIIAVFVETRDLKEEKMAMQIVMNSKA